MSQASARGFFVPVEPETAELLQCLIILLENVTQLKINHSHNLLTTTLGSHHKGNMFVFQYSLYKTWLILG